MRCIEKVLTFYSWFNDETGKVIKEFFKSLKKISERFAIRER